MNHITSEFSRLLRRCASVKAGDAGAGKTMELTHPHNVDYYSYKYPYCEVRYENHSDDP